MRMQPIPQYQFRWLSGVAVISILAVTVTCAAAELKPEVSVVDFLKANNQPSSMTDRAALYSEHIRKAEKYVGSAGQNVQLLVKLVEANSEAAKLAADAQKIAQESAKKALPAEAALVVHNACPGWVPAEGFGFLGSYGFTVRAVKNNNVIVDKDFVVAVRTAAAEKGPVSVAGSVEVLVDGKSSQSVKLQEPWFSTVGQAGDKTRLVYATKGSSISLPPGKRVEAVISLNITVKTPEGLVALWPCSRRIDLSSP